MISGSPAEAAKELVRRLREEARVAVILVIAEQRDGKLNRATWETIAAAQQLAGRHADQGRACSVGRRRRRRRSSPAAASPRCSSSSIRRSRSYTPDAFTMALQRRHRAARRRSSCCCRTPTRRATSRRCSPRGCASRSSPTSPASRAPARRATFIAADVPGQAGRRGEAGRRRAVVRHVPDRRVPRRCRAEGRHRAGDAGRA